MTSVYILNPNEAPMLPQTLMSLVFWPNYRFDIPAKRLFLREIMAQYETPFFTLANSPTSADFVAVPFEYFFAEAYAPEYLSRTYQLAKKAGKKVLLFDYTDYVDRNPALPPHAALFRISAYRHHKRRNEIVMPYFVQDIGSVYGITAKEKGTPLVVGYCGQARFGSATKEWKAVLKRAWHSTLLALKGDEYPQAHTRGIFLRRAAIHALRAGGISNRVIERSFYSLHRSAASFDPSSVRQEYSENLRTCDLALCARGDANASQRFYEALSASRIPLFLDTDCVLPLEEVVDYDTALFRVSVRDITALPARIRSWCEKESPESFLARGKRAREIYENYLCLGRYFEFVFNREKSPYKRILFT